MKQIKAIYKKTGRIHHAYGLLGDREKIKKELLAFLHKDMKFPTVGNPDFWSEDFNVFKIDDSRALNQAHLNKPVKYDQKVFVISANFMTKDAQNSLLKIFEEPRADSVFFLILSETVNLLPTFKSRLLLEKINTGNFEHNRPGHQNDHPALTKAGKGEDAEEFLRVKVGRRLQIVAKMVKDIKDEKSTKSHAISFLKNLEREIRANLKPGSSFTAKGKNLLAMEDIEKAISYAGDESPSIKVILEHLALVLPE